MIARTGRYVPSRPWPRRALAALGRGVLRSTGNVLLFTSFGATVVLAAFRPGVWRGPAWVEFKRALHEVAVRSLATTVVTGILVGFALSLIHI